jgi:hypothetical protein
MSNVNTEAETEEMDQREIEQAKRIIEEGGGDS